MRIQLPQQLQKMLDDRRKKEAKSHKNYRRRCRARQQKQKQREMLRLQQKETQKLQREATLNRLKREHETFKSRYEESLGEVRRKRFVPHSREQLHYLIQNNSEEGLVERKVDGKGRCIFATRFFNKGQFVCNYLGEYITNAEGKEREREYAKDPEIGSFLFFVQEGRKRFCIDATAEAPGMGRLISHSRLLPNLHQKLEPIENKQHVYFRASEDIFPGEELKYDYGETRQEVLDELSWFEES